MARKPKVQTAEPDESLALVFFRGFFWPLRTVWRGLAWVCGRLGRGLGWLGHRPPLKQIGHALRWFFRSPPLRFTGKALGFGYVRNSFRELKEVTWPTWAESRRLTGAVILFAVIFGALIAVADYGLDKLFKQLLLK